MMPNFLALAFNMPTLIILLALALLIFGNRLPTLGRDLGRSIKGFKKGLAEDGKDRDDDDDDEDDDDDDIEPPAKKKSKQLPAESTRETASQRETESETASR